MIMPCINATSAGDAFGTVGRVEGGSVRLGSPGAQAGLQPRGLPGFPSVHAPPGRAIPRGQAPTKAGGAASQVLSPIGTLPCGGRSNPSISVSP